MSCNTPFSHPSLQRRESDLLSLRWDSKKNENAAETLGKSQSMVMRRYEEDFREA